MYILGKSVLSLGMHLQTAEVSSPKNSRGFSGDGGKTNTDEIFLTAENVEPVFPTLRFLVADTLLSGNMEARLPATLTACQSPAAPS